MNKYKKEIIGGIIILFLMVAGFTSVSTSAFRWIGKVKLLDTLNGNLKLNHGLWLSGDSLNDVSKVNTTSVQAGGGYFFTDQSRYIDDDGSTLTFAADDYTFLNQTGRRLLGITPTGALTLNLTSDSLRIEDVVASGMVGTPEGYVKVFVGGTPYFIQLYTTAPGE